MIGAGSSTGLRAFSLEATLAAWGGVAAACDVVCAAGMAVVATAGSLVLAARFQSQAAAGPAAKATAAKVVTTRSFVMAGLLLKQTVLYHDRDRPDRSERSRNRKLAPSWISKRSPQRGLAERNPPFPSPIMPNPPWALCALRLIVVPFRGSVGISPPCRPS